MRVAPLVLLAVSVAFLSPAAARADQEPEAAYRDKDWADAVFLYRKWLEADPRDENSWYNLACCYALAGQREAALEALATAVVAGWKDTEWPTRDEDLVSIRDDERFAKILADAAARQDDDAPASYARHYVAIPAIGTYVAMLPPDYEAADTACPLVVILHGNGSTETRHGRLADRLGRAGVIYVAPRAPYPNHGVFTAMRQPGWTWRPEDAEEEAIEALEPSRLYVDSVLAAVADARKRYRVRGERFHVLGHSMGGFFANVVAMRHPDRVASYLSYAGGLPEAYQGTRWLEGLKEHGVRALLVHGEADPVVSPDLSTKAHELLRAAGVDVELALLPGVDHGIAPAAAQRMAAWVRGTVRGEGGEGE